MSDLKAHSCEACSPNASKATEEEKQQQIENLRAWQRFHEPVTADALGHLTTTAKAGGNLFEALMQTTQVASLGQISAALYRVGGQYRRAM